MTNKNPIAVITGGSRGIGRSAAINVAQLGMDVIIAYKNNEEEAGKTVDSLRQLGVKAESLQLDVADTKSFEDFAVVLQETLTDRFHVEQFTCLVNNAGTGLHSSFENTTEEQLDDMFNVHFKGAFFITQKLLPLIADGGRIVNISSGLARFALPGSSAYGSMKGAVEVLSRYMAKEFAPRGITVNVIAPGAVATDFRGGAIRDNPEVNKQVAALSKRSINPVWRIVRERRMIVPTYNQRGHVCQIISQSYRGRWWWAANRTDARSTISRPNGSSSRFA